jgi:glycosyltransferase involved in cell wall biosynthesis
LDWKRKKWGLFARIFLWLCEYAAVLFPDKTIVVSKTLKCHFEHKFKKKVQYIPNGAEPQPVNTGFTQGSGEKPYILFVGRLVPEKGLGYLIRAFNGLNTDFQLIIAGEPSFTEKYVFSLKKMAGSNVFFPGFAGREELHDLYSKAYLFVLPSEVEGLPVSLLEAMSYGRCVLLSDIPECLEVAGDCGIYFKAGEDSDLKKKLKYLIENPGLVSEYGSRCKKRISEEYSWDGIVENIKKIYLSLST